VTGADPLRVALLLYRGAPVAAETDVADVAAGLGDVGVSATVVRAPRLPEAPLRFRGFTGPLTHIPMAATALWRGRYDLTHAFSAPDAAAALLWRRASGRPVVFGCREVLDRAAVADRRLRLRLLIAAVDGTDAVVATAPEVREALLRWMAVDAPVIEPRDGAAHARLYRRLR
jgi:hypothetical protein